MSSENTGFMSAAFGSMGAASAAIVGSLCCVGTKILIALGLGGMLSATAIAPYRAHLLIASAVLVATAFWGIHRSGRKPRPALRVTVWSAAVLLVATTGFVYLAP